MLLLARSVASPPSPTPVVDDGPHPVAMPDGRPQPSAAVPALESDDQSQTGPVAVAVELDETLKVATVPQATRQRCHPDGPLYQVDHQKGNGTVPDKDTVSQEGTIPDEERVSQKGTDQ